MVKFVGGPRIEVGDEFELLTVVRPAPERGGTHYVCECFCGRETIALRFDLLAGKRKSCGCIRGEARIIRPLRVIDYARWFEPNTPTKRERAVRRIVRELKEEAGL